MLNKFKIIVITLLVLALSAPFAFAVSVESMGEALISNNDIGSAKSMAVSRAKWAALEQASGIKMKVDTIINNAQLADEAVKSELSGTIKNFKITDEGKDGDTYWVTIKADIQPESAKDIIGGFAKNTSIAVIIPAVLPDGSSELTHAFSEAVVNGLLDKGFEVNDIASGSNSSSIRSIEMAISTNNFEELKNIAASYMAETILVGKVKVISKGNDIGYGKVDFSIVDGDIDWRLLGNKDGKMSILASGTYSGRGQGATLNSAASNLYKNLSKETAVKLVSAVSQKILGENAKSIRVALKGESNPRYLKELREDVKNVPFVLGINEQGLDSIIVDYPEKTYYLATFLTRNNKYKVVRMDESEIIIERR